MSNTWSDHGDRLAGIERRIVYCGSVNIVQRHIAVADIQCLTHADNDGVRNVVAIHLIDFNRSGRRSESLAFKSIAYINKYVSQTAVFNNGVFGR